LDACKERYLDGESRLRQEQIFGCDHDDRSIRFNRIQRDTKVFFREASTLRNLVVPNLFAAGEEPYVLYPVDLTTCGWPCVTISGMAFFSGEDQPNKKRCIEDKDGDTGEGFSHYEGLLQVAPSTVFVGETVQERVENCGTKATC
jgi:hypothetical protein